MINRVLIRIKVVQLLYSTLITETTFNLESSPSPTTKEKRFAYSLYLSNLLLFQRLAEKIKQSNKKGFVLADSRFIKKISSQEEIKSLAARSPEADWFFKEAEDKLVSLISQSALFKEYAKNYPESENEKIWEQIYNLIIKPDEAYKKAISNYPNYSLGG